MRWKKLKKQAMMMKKARFKPGYTAERILRILHRRRIFPRLFIRALAFLGYERHIRKYFKVKQSEVFIDVGASKGFYSWLMSGKCKKVIAFEPNPKTFKALKKNTENFENVECVNVALGDKREVVEFHTHKAGVHNGSVWKREDYVKTIRVNVEKLDSFDLNTDQIGLIKLDVEGFEVPVLEGGFETIRRHKPRLIVELHDLGDERVIRELLPFYSWKREVGHLIGESA